MAGRYERTWHPVQSLRCIQWAMPRPGTRERFAVITHEQTADGWVFVGRGVGGEEYGQFASLEEAAVGVYRHALHGLVRPGLNGYGAYENKETGERD